MSIAHQSSDRNLRLWCTFSNALLSSSIRRERSSRVQTVPSRRPCEAASCCSYKGVWFAGFPSSHVYQETGSSFTLFVWSEQLSVPSVHLRCHLHEHSRVRLKVHPLAEQAKKYIWCHEGAPYTTVRHISHTADHGSLADHTLKSWESKNTHHLLIHRIFITRWDGFQVWAR